MKTEKLTWGLILIFIGTIFLLTNLGIIDFHWRSVWRLWPVILIIAGINILVTRYIENGGAIIAAVVTVLILGFVFYQGTRPAGPDSERWNFKYDASKNGNRTTNTFTEPFLSSKKYARLNIVGGAATYSLSDSTSNLFDADVAASKGRYLLTKTSTDSSEILTFKAKDGQRTWNMDRDGGDDATIKLNTAPIWNIDIRMGAGETKFDLSDFKVSNLNVNGGAASFKVKLGPPQQVTTINVETGLAETQIKVPKSAPCKISVKAGLSSEDFDDFVKQGNGTYITPGYNEKEPHFVITLKGGLADFEVNRY